MAESEMFIPRETDARVWGQCVCVGGGCISEKAAAPYAEGLQILVTTNQTAKAYKYRRNLNAKCYSRSVHSQEFAKWQL